MNRKELIDALSFEMAAKHNANPIRARLEEMVDFLGKVARAELQKGGTVLLPGLGKLSAKRRGERAGRNPRTGKPVTIPACMVAKFAPCKALKDTLAVAVGESSSLTD